MTLKINSMYRIADGYLIPRSHWSEGTPPKYAIFEHLQGGGKSYIKSTITLSLKECRKILGLTVKEGVEIYEDYNNEQRHCKGQNECFS